MRKSKNRIYRFLLMMTTVAFVLSLSLVSTGADTPPQVCSIGTFGTGEGQFQNPYGLAVDEVRGYIYVADTGNNKIRKFNLFGEYQDSFGSSGTDDRQFLHPQGVGVDSSNGDIYVVDTVNQRIQKFDSSYNFLLKFGSSGSQEDQFYLPRDIAIDSDGNVYICDSGNDRISKFTSSGEFSATIGQDSSLVDPYGIDVDSSGNIYVADTGNHRIVKFAPDGSKSLEFGSYGTQPGEFRFPHDVAIDKKGNIFVADTDNYRIQKFNAQGVYLNSFGAFLDFLSPQKLAIDSNDNLYVIDSNTNRLSIYNVSTYIENVFAEPTPFSPDGDGFEDTTFVHYTIPEPAKITVTIYDEEGNLVRELIEGVQRLTSENQEGWDGKNDSAAFVDAGVYTCKVDAINTANYHAPQRSCVITVRYPTGKISGTVSDGISPIYNVTVSDGTRWTKTDAEGNYTITNVPVGTYIVTASKTGYHSKNREVTLIIEGEEITGVDFTLNPSAPRTGKISGTVTDGTAPLEAVTVSDGTRSDQTNTEGKYTIEDIPAGTYTVIASKEGYRTPSTIVTVGEGAIITGVDFILEESSESDIRVEPTILEFRVKPGQGSLSSASASSASEKQASAPASSENADMDYSSEALKGKIIPGEYIIRFKKRVEKSAQQDVLTRIDAVLLKEIKAYNASLVRHPEITTEVLVTAKGRPDEFRLIEAKLAEFKLTMSELATSKSELIEYIEPNREVYALGAGTSTPDDPYFDEQWGPQKIDAPMAWDIEAGEISVVVAVVDSGVDYTHEDLTANYIAGGYDFVDDDNDPYPSPNGIDDDGDGLIDEGVDHGTHVAGIIAAETNNAKGIAGIAQINILAERVLNSDGLGTSFEVVDGINHAVTQGAKIINLSLGGGGTSLERDACQDAWDSGCIIVAAAGNDYGGPVSYPAAYLTVIAVSATDSEDNIANFSSVGLEVELAAPGVSILSTIKDGVYEAKSGTSMSAPHVAGVAALVCSINSQLTNEEVREILRDSADDLGTLGRDNNFGYGRINAYKAVLYSGGLYQSQSLTVYNDGGVDLVITDITNTYDWLSVDKTSFTVACGGSLEIIISVVSADLTEGTYEDTIEIFSNDPIENPCQIPVTIIVSGNFAPIISGLPDRILNEDASLDNTVDLWEYTIDTETNDEDLTFSISQNTDSDCGVSIDSNRYIDINPTADWSGLSDVTIRVTDPAGFWDEDTFTVTVNPVNDKPMLDTIGNKSVNEGYLLQSTISAIDLDGDPLSYSASNLPTGASFDAPTHTFSWTPTYEQAGTYPNVHFEVSDGLATDSEDITITVNNVNRPPVLDPIGNKSIDEGQTLNFTVSATDPDGDSLTYSASNLPTGAEFNAATKTFSWTPTYDQAGTYPNVHFEVTDGSLTDSEDITITVNNVNRPPVLDPIADITVNEGEIVTFNPTASDPDGDSLTFTYSGWMTSSTYTTNYDDAGVHIVTVTVSDGDLTDFQDVTVTVNNVNRAPIADNQNLTTDEDISINITLTATDLDGDSLTYAIVAQPSYGALSGGAPNLTYTPNINYNGTDSFDFKANDGIDDSNIATVSLIINPVNDAPVLDPIGNKSVNENTLLTFIVNAVDPDGDPLTYSASNLPTGASFDALTQQFSWTPTYIQAGAYQVLFEVFDGEFTDSEEITIQVNNVPPDFDLDGDVDWADLAVFTVSWLKRVGEPGYNPRCDFNNDGIVNFIDYAIFANEWDPHPPSSLSAQAVSSTRINLSWQDNTDGESGFKIERKIGTTGTFQQIATEGPDETTHSDSGLEADTTYYYRVHAYKAVFGFGTSGYSNEASATTELNHPPVVSTIPNQIILQGEEFATINLDDYVKDIHTPDSQISWEVSGATQLDVYIDVDRVATITYQDGWTGSETVNFVATDPDGLSDSTEATFIVARDSQEIQDDIDATLPGCSVPIQPGIYKLTSNLNITKAITLKAIDPDPDNTVVILGDYSIIVKFPQPPADYSLASVTIEGVTMTGYSGKSKNGPIQNYWANLTLRNCKIVDNKGIKASAIYNSWHSIINLENTLIGKNINIPSNDIYQYGSSPFRGYLWGELYCGTIYLDWFSKLNVNTSTIADNINASMPITIQTGYGETGYGQTGYGTRNFNIVYGAIQRSMSNRVEMTNSIMWNNGRGYEPKDFSYVLPYNQIRIIVNSDIQNLDIITRYDYLEAVIKEDPEFDPEDNDYYPQNQNCLDRNMGARFIK